jgi:thiosulfate reductase / polysulfide reductase chain A
MGSGRPPEAQGVPTVGRRTVYSLCGMCSVRCPIQVEVEDGVITWIQGNPNDEAMGPSLCAKGSAGLSFLYDNERPQHPFIRTGPRGSGQWRQASWDEALDFVASRLAGVMDRYGARGVALSDRGGPFTDLTRSFLKALGSPNYFNHDCTCGSNAHHATLSLLGVGREGIAYDIRNTRHIVLYGRNILESLQVKEARAFVEAVSRRDARCTYIDPRATLTAAKATRFWQIRPGTDYALNLALIHTVLAEKLYDASFLSRWVTGLESLESFVRGKTPEWQERYTGIPAAQVRRFAEEIAKEAPRVIFHAGWMTARNRQSFYVSRSSLILNVLLGAMEVPGGVVLAKGLQDTGKKPLQRLCDRIPEPLEARVDGCGSRDDHFDGGPGLLHRLFPVLESSDPYPVGAYLAYRHDPLVSMPDTEALKRSLDRLELLVSIDVNYSETAWYSDVILPESSYLERANILASREGPVPCVYIRDQAVAPRFDSRPAWWIFRELARRLGAGRYFDFDTIEDFWSYQLEGTRISLPEIRDKGFLPLAERPILWDRDTGLRFRTPSGKIELVSSRLARAGQESFAEFQPPPDLESDEFRLLFGRTAVHTHGQTMNNPLLNELVPENVIWVHPERAWTLGLKDGDLAEISRQGTAAEGRVKVTPWIHGDAIFTLHGFGRTVPLQSRAAGKGIADQRLQRGLLTVYDPVGGGNALCECIVRLRKKHGGVAGRDE